MSEVAVAKIEIALSSTDGKVWTDINGDQVNAADVDGIVTRVVIGKLGKDEEIEQGIELLREALSLHGPSITHLHLWNLKNLDALEALPSKLQCLDLRGCNALTRIPDLPETLETLDLEGCENLGEIAVKESSKLEYLHLDGCTRLPKKQIHQLIENSTNLRELTLSRCTQLTKLKRGSVAAHQQLWKLVLANCTTLEKLPSLAELKSLRHLDLSGCESLVTLPDIPDHLQYLIVFGCDRLSEFLEQGIGEIDRGKNHEENVADWFHFRKRFGEVIEIEPRAKLLLLGDGRAGKTSLAKALNRAALGPDLAASEEYCYLQHDPGESPTHSIQFFSWRTPFSLPVDARNFLSRQQPGCPEQELSGIVHLWDFGGQEIYHRTHRIFAAEGTVFLLVWKANADDDQVDKSCPEDMTLEAWREINKVRPLDYWLRYLESLGDGVRFAFVCTHCPPETDTPKWRKRVKNRRYKEELKAKAFQADSSEIDFGKNPEHQDLLEWIADSLGTEASQLGLRQPQIIAEAMRWIEGYLKGRSGSGAGLKNPEPTMLDWESWKNILSRLEAYRPEYWTIVSAQDCATASDEDQRKFDSDARLLTRYLHQSGHLFYLNEQGYERVIIDQQEALEYVYEILRPDGPLRKKIESNGGWFEREDLVASPTWRALQSQPEQERYLAMMEQCGLIVMVPYWRRDSAPPRTVFIANEKWLLPKFESVEAKANRDMQRLGANPDSYDLPLKKTECNEFDFRALMAELGKELGRAALWAREGMQAMPKGLNPEWCLRIIWTPADEIGFFGKLTVQLFTRKGRLEDWINPTRELLDSAGFAVAGKNEVRPVPEHLRDFGKSMRYYLNKEPPRVGLSRSGKDETVANALITELERRGVEGIRDYRKPEWNEVIREKGLLHYMEGPLAESHVMILLLSDDYLTADPEKPHCAWELAYAIGQIKNGDRSRDRLLVAISSELPKHDLGSKIQDCLEFYADHFLEKYQRERKSPGVQKQNLELHRCFQNALEYREEFTTLFGQFGYFETIGAENLESLVQSILENQGKD